LVINKGAVERGMFNGCKLTFKKVELEQREEFANPDITNTIDIKDACYDKLTNGILKKGTIIYKNDVVIGKIIKLPRNSDDDYQYADRSIVYKENEPAIVHDVIVDRNEKDERFCKVVLRKVRPIDIGDKFSVIGTSQVLTDKGWKEIQNMLEI
jgi:DNA-directed RNA polymerase beta subunit